MPNNTWVYVRDDAPFAGRDPPAALFRYSRNRSGDHPVEHLRTFAGILQADAYAGYRQGRSERFLSPEEYRRLAEVLERREGDRPFHVAAVRLLVLTGCRKGEILTLRWSDYREGHLFLPDSKTGVNFLPMPVESLQCHAMPN